MAPATTPMHSRLAIFIPSRLEWDSAGDFKLTGSGFAFACVKFTHFARASRRFCDVVVKMDCIRFY